MKRLVVSSLLLALAPAAGWAQSDTQLPGQNPNGPQPHGWIQPLGPPLWDNGGPDGVNGFSNGTVGAVGARRALLDDFVVPGPDSWSVENFTWTHVWNTLTPPAGTGHELRFVADAAGAPDLGAVIAVANVTSYTEVATGNIFFSRPEAESMSTFDPILLGPGTYWFEHLIVGPENNFQLTAPRMGTECWVNYDDLGFTPCFDQFGIDTDVNFRIGGTVVIPAELIEVGID